MSLGGGVTVMEKREILVGWVTKICLKCTKKAGVGREGDICIYDCNYCTHSINFFKLTNVMSFSAELFAKGNCYRQNTLRQYPLVVRHVTATVKNWSSVKQ